MRAIFPESLIVNRRPTFSIPSLLAALVVSLLAALSLFFLVNDHVFAHDENNLPTDHDVETHVHFPENSDNMVRDFDSEDPEEADIIWSIRGVDEADFTIDSNGVLRFAPGIVPDYENPTDRGLNLNPADADTGDADEFTDPGEFAPGDNDYQITVSATETWDGNDQSLPAKRTDRHLTVTVTDEDDRGEFDLQWRQPEVGTAITAELTDEDGTVDTIAGGVIGTTAKVRGYTWYVSKVPGIPQVGVLTHWNEVGTQPDSSTYIPVETDASSTAPKYLRAEVVYTDDQSTTSPRTLNAVSEYPVRAEVEPGVSGSPDFGERKEDTRTVLESVAVGANVGPAVTAADRSEDVLTYELIEAPAPNASDFNYFNINKTTGQITVAQALDADRVGDRDGDGTDDTGTAGEYVVIVRATDPSALLDNITITVTAEDVNESPIVTGRSVLEIDEDSEFSADAGSPSEYNIEQEDVVDSVAGWRLEGDDKDEFTFSGGDPIYLKFEAEPDFENPTDADRDNVYEVTIVATDDDPLGTGAEEGRKDVWVVVNNVDEDGEVVFVEGDTAYLDQELVAEVQDPDDHGGDPGEPYQGVHVVSWEWSRAGTEDGTFIAIPGETRNRYTPTVAGGDDGQYLRVTATYTDPFSAADVVDGDQEDERVVGTVTDTGTDLERTTSLVTKSLTTAYAVRRELAPGSAPAFPSSASTRSVDENTPPGGPVGKPVEAELQDATLLYSLLDGPDRKYFNIDGATGQITVGGDAGQGEAGTDPELDWEDGRRAYSVTVKAAVEDGEPQQVAQVTVIIAVADVDEALTVKEKGVEDAPELPQDANNDDIDDTEAKTYLEIKDGAPNTDAVVEYIGDDPEGASVSWDLRGADASFFTIENGVLEFRNPPDYENAMDIGDPDDETATPGVSGGDNIYSVQVRAIAGRATGYTGPAQTVEFLVNVTVGDVDEPGTIVLSRLQPEVALPVADRTKTINLPGGGTTQVVLNTDVTARLYDPDAVTDTNQDGAVTSGVTWVWTVSKVSAQFDLKDENHWEPGAGNVAVNVYTPGENDALSTTDEGDYLRVVATYDDGTATEDDPDTTDVDESDDVVRVRSVYVVQAAEGGFANSSPDFRDEELERSVAETANAGASVGLPVRVVTGGNSPRDRLTYSLVADTINTVDIGYFNINQVTGQITLARKLDADAIESGRTGANKAGEYKVTVMAIDPSGLSDTVSVVITAEDENDNPVLEGRAELIIDENESLPITESDELQDPDDVNYYSLTDAEKDAVVSWRREGADAALFIYDEAHEGTRGRGLVFKPGFTPDFENPADADGDNVYKVTIVADDGKGGLAKFEVCIAVENVREDGMIALEDGDGNEVTQPYSFSPITAKLDDSDGGVKEPVGANIDMWQWSRSLTEGGTYDSIEDENKATYEPTIDDVGFYLRVTANYRDAWSDDANVAPAVVGTTAHAVLGGTPLTGSPPAFMVDGADIEEISVEVAENSPATTYVGDPLPEAVDPDDEDAKPVYSLAGLTKDHDDSKYFALREVNGERTLQLVVEQPISDGATAPDTEMFHPVDLDKEDSKKNTFMFLLKAAESSSEDALSDTLTVTVTVTDRNEAPSMPAVPEEDDTTTPGANNAPEFPGATTTRRVAEGAAVGVDVGTPVAATDADDDTLTYSLGGADRTSFSIDDTGQLSTAIVIPDASVKASYVVEVIANDGNGGTDSVTVTIDVTAAGGLGAAAHGYDGDGNGEIDADEVLDAVEDYFADVITPAQVLDVVELYFTS